MDLNSTRTAANTISPEVEKPKPYGDTLHDFFVENRSQFEPSGITPEGLAQKAYETHGAASGKDYDTWSKDVGLGDFVPRTQSRLAELKAKDEWDAAKPEDRGSLATFGTALGRGAMDFVSMAGGALSVLDGDPSSIDTDKNLLDTVGGKLTNWADTTREKSQALRMTKEEEANADTPGFFQGGGVRGLKNELLSGVESVTLSAGTAALGAGIGALAAPALGIGAGAAAIAGGVAALGGIFFGGTYDKEFTEQRDKIRKVNPNDSEQEIIGKTKTLAAEKAGWEAGTEVLSDLVAGAIVLGTGGLGTPAAGAIKTGVKGLLKPGLKTFLKRTALGALATVPSESGTEMLSAAMQDKAMADAGLEHMGMKDAAISAFIPSLVPSIFFGVGGASIGKVRANKLLRDINSEDVEARAKAVNDIAAGINQNTKDKELATAWLRIANQHVIEGKPIDVNEDIAAFAAADTRTSAAAEGTPIEPTLTPEEMAEYAPSMLQQPEAEPLSPAETLLTDGERTTPEAVLMGDAETVTGQDQLPSSTLEQKPEDLDAEWNRRMEDRQVEADTRALDAEWVTRQRIKELDAEIRQLSTGRGRGTKKRLEAAQVAKQERKRLLDQLAQGQVSQQAVEIGTTQEIFDQAPVEDLAEEPVGSEVATQLPAPQQSPSIPYDTVSFVGEGQPLARASGESPVINFGDRIMTVRMINGVQVPFYLSTGNGGKKDVPSGKWYPFFGIGADGWINKTGGQEMTSYYGMEELRRAAEELDSSIGDVRGDKTVPRVSANGRHIDFLNTGFTPAENAHSTTPKIVRDNIESLRQRLSQNSAPEVQGDDAAIDNLDAEWTKRQAEMEARAADLRKRAANLTAPEGKRNSQDRDAMLQKVKDELQQIEAEQLSPAPSPIAAPPSAVDEGAISAQGEVKGTPVPLTNVAPTERIVDQGVENVSDKADLPSAETVTAPSQGEASLESAMQSSTRKTSYGTMEDPIAQSILAMKRFRADLPNAEVAARRHGATSFAPYSGGASSVVIDGGPVVVRLVEQKIDPRIVSENILQPLETGLNWEILPKADTTNITEKDVAEMKARLESEGLDFHDPGTDQLGRVDGKMMVLDPGSVRKAKPDELQLLLGTADLTPEQEAENARAFEAEEAKTKDRVEASLKPIRDEIARLEKEMDAQAAEAAKWEGKQYKDNKTKVTVGDSGSMNDSPTTQTIGEINAGKRSKAIQAAHRAYNDAAKRKAALEEMLGGEQEFTGDINRAVDDRLKDKESPVKFENLFKRQAREKAQSRPSQPEVKDAQVAGEKGDPRDKHFGTLIKTKAAKNMGDGIYFFDKKFMTVARIQRLQTERDQKSAGLPVTRTDSFEFKSWADVTGDRAASGYAILDRRQRNAERSQPSTQGPQDEAETEALLGEGAKGKKPMVKKGAKAGRWFDAVRAWTNGEKFTNVRPDIVERAWDDNSLVTHDEIDSFVDWLEKNKVDSYRIERMRRIIQTLKGERTGKYYISIHKGDHGPNRVEVKFDKNGDGVTESSEYVGSVEEAHRLGKKAGLEQNLDENGEPNISYLRGNNVVMGKPSTTASLEKFGDVYRFKYSEDGQHVDRKTLKAMKDFLDTQFFDGWEAMAPEIARMRRDGEIDQLAERSAEMNAESIFALKALAKSEDIDVPKDATKEWLIAELLKGDIKAAAEKAAETAEPSSQVVKEVKKDVAAVPNDRAAMVHHIAALPYNLQGIAATEAAKQLGLPVDAANQLLADGINFAGKFTQEDELAAMNALVPTPQWVKINRDKTVEANIPEAAKEKLTLKQQKEWLLVEIDKAIASGRATGKPFEFHVPGDGHMRVAANGLASFKKRVEERFPEKSRPSALGKNPSRPVQSSKGRVNEGEYYNEWQDYEVKLDAIYKPEEKDSPFPAWDAKTGVLHNGTSMIVLPKKPMLKGLKESKADTGMFIEYSTKEISERAEIVGQFKRMSLDSDDEQKMQTGDKKTREILGIAAEKASIVFAHVRYDGKDAFFPADKIDMLRTQYPKADIRVSKNGTQLGFFNAGRIVGVAMGFEGVELSDYHKARMEEIAAKKEGRTPKLTAADTPVEAKPLTKDEQEGVDLLVGLATGEKTAESAPVLGRTKWFVNYSDTNNGRTTEVKPFATLKEARDFAQGKFGYISKYEDTGNGYETDKVTNTFKEYVGGFEPSPTEAQSMKGMFGEVPKPAPVQEEKAGTPELQYVNPSSIDTPIQGALASAVENKKKAFARVKDLRQKIKDAPIGAKSQLRVMLLRAETPWREAQRAEQEALKAIEKRANELGQTTKKPQYQVKENTPSPIDLRAAFPWADSITEQDGRTVVMKGKVSFAIEQVETISPNEVAFRASYGRNRGASEQIAGEFLPGKATIRLSKVADQWTVQHEYEHFLEDMGLITPFERGVLDAAIKRDEKAGTLKFIPGTGKDRMKPAELRAYYVQHELAARDFQRKTTLGRVLQKVADFVDALANLFVRTSRGVVRDVESGAMMGRESLQADVMEGMRGFQTKDVKPATLTGLRGLAQRQVASLREMDAAIDSVDGIDIERWTKLSDEMSEARAEIIKRLAEEQKPFVIPLGWGGSIFVHPSSKENGKWQATRMNANNEPVGDTLYNSAAQAFKDVVDTTSAEDLNAALDGSTKQYFQYALPTSTTEAVQKAKELKEDVLKRPEVFGVFNSINTQLHKALKQPAFKRIFDRFHAAAGTQQRAAARAASLAPDILPDHSGNFKQSVRELFTKTREFSNNDLKHVSRVMSMETLAGKNASPFSGHRLTDVNRADFKSDAEYEAALEKTEIGALLRGETLTVGGNEISMTKKQVSLYRQSRAALDQMLTEMATSEAWRIIRGVLTTHQSSNGEFNAKDYWEVFADQPNEAAEAMKGMLNRELEKGQARLTQAEMAAHAMAGADDMEGFREYGKKLTKLNKALDNKEKFSPKQLEDGDLDAIIAKREERIEKLADELGIDASDAEERLKEYKAALKEYNAASQNVENINGAFKGIADVFEKSGQLIKAGYAPLSRFGQYRIDVRDNDGKLIHTSFYDSSTEANRERRGLVKAFDGYEGGAVVGDVQTISQEDWKAFQGANPEALRLFAEKAGAESDEVIQAYYQDAISSRSALKRLINRQGYAGYSEDLQRIMASFITSGAKRVGSNYHSADINEMVNDEKLPADLRDEARKLKMFIDNPGDAGSAFRAFAANWYMLGSFMSAAWNGTQVFTSTVPELYKNGGTIAGAVGGVLKGYRTLIRNGADLSPTEKAALKKAMQDGTVDAAEIHHLYAQATKRFIHRLGNGEAAKRAGAFLRLWGMPFAWFEVMNRKASFIAAYRMGEDQGADDAYAFAKQLVDITQGIYSKQNRMNIARSPVGGAVMTFMQYKIMTLEQIARNAKEGGQARKAAALQLAIIAAIGGWKALPGVEDITDLYDTIMQAVFGKATLSKKAMREAVEKGSIEAAGLVLEKESAAAVGKFFADAVNVGIVTAALPVDVSGRASMGGLIPGLKLLKPSTQYRDSIVFDMAGVPGSMIDSLIDASGMILQGDMGRAAMRLAPNAVGAAAKGIDIFATGEIKNTRGKKVTDGTPLDGALQMVGAQPKDKARINTRLRENQELKFLTQSTEKSIVSEWADAYEKKGVVAQREALVAVRKRIADWNSANPDWPIVVKQTQVMNELKNRKKTTVQLASKSAPKELRKSMAVE